MKPCGGFCLAIVAIGFVSQVAHGQVTGGHLKWIFEAREGFSPYNSPYSPVIARGQKIGDERVAALSKDVDGKWVVNGLSINDGTRIWDAVLPFTEEGDIGQGLLSANPSQFLQNSINLVFIISPGVLIALDGVTGEPSWQWPIPSKNSLVSVSGWNDFVGLMLQGEPIVSPYFPAIIRPTVLAALDSNNGNLLWLQNATDILPLSQADAATYAVERIEASREGLLYSRANKLNLIDWRSGDLIWETSVSLEGSVGTGQGANITHMSYLPRHELSDEGPDRILLNANNWGFQRFVLMQFNTTNSSVPASPLWRSRFPETSLLDVYMSAPTADTSPQSDMFYYWSNRTNWNVAENPTSETYLVGKKLSDGKEVWSARMDPIGLPAVYYGRVFVTAVDGLHAIQGSSGSTIWSINGDPSQNYSYGVSPTFSNNTGLMVSSRCMHSDIPTLCMYSAFYPAENAGQRILGTITLFISIFICHAMS